jgi:hypothetical protein
MSRNAEPTVHARLVAATALAFCLAGASPAVAGPIHERQENQDERIDRGAATGALTRHESNVLENQQSVIDHARGRAIANDGKLGKREAQRLTRAQNRASRNIARLKHNQRTTP